MNLMNKTTKNELLSEFEGVLNKIGTKPSDEIESDLRVISHKIRPLIHLV